MSDKTQPYLDLFRFAADNARAEFGQYRPPLYLDEVAPCCGRKRRDCDCRLLPEQE